MMFEQIKYSFKNLFRKRFRTTLTVMSICIGVAAVVMITTISEVGKAAINTELNSLGLDGITLGADKKLLSATLGEKELETVKRNSAVACAAPVVVSYTEAKLRGLVADTLVWGIDQNAEKVISLTTKYGRLINKNDIKEGRAETIAKSFYKRENIVGKEIRLLLKDGYQNFTVVGVVTSGGNVFQSLAVGYIPSFVYLPYTAIGNKAEVKSFDQIIIKLKEQEEAEIIGEEIVNTLSAMNGVSKAYSTENIIAQKQSLNKMLDIVTLLLSVIAGISLMVAGLGIMTVMLVSVNERTREIGIKKSIGATPKVIVTEFLYEAFLLSLMGCLSGVALGILFAAAGCIIFSLPLLLNFKMILLCFAFTLMIGVLFGAYPAKLAAKLKPVDALRFE
ncbi:MAG: ABC transporter permease [Oscillospiraceae bacterium]